MRAGRVISMLFALQQHGQLTASELAGRLEVSVRTVLRDVETLSEAGVPIYAVQGAGGGIRLLDGFADQLTTLTPDEAEVLLLAGQPRLAAVLGVGPAASAARSKLLAALPGGLPAAAESLGGWFLHDPAGRRGRPGAEAALIRLTARAIRAQVELRPLDDTRPAWVRCPLGLVLEAGDWQLVHLAAAGPQVQPLAELADAGRRAGGYVLGRGFTRPAGFDLAVFWDSLRSLGRPRAGRPGSGHR